MATINGNKPIRPFYISDSEEVNALWSQNLATNLPTVAVRLGVPAALVTKVTDNNAALQATKNTMSALQKWLDQWRTTKRNLYNGYPDDPTLPVPFPGAVTLPTLPDPAPAYVLAPHIQAVNIILANPDTTDADRELLQLVRAEGLPTPPEAANRVKADEYNYPLIKVSVGNNMFTVTVTRGNRWRGKAMLLQVDREGKGEFVTLVNTTSRSYSEIITLPPQQLTAAWTFRAIYVEGTTLKSDWCPDAGVVVRQEPVPFEA